MKFKLWKIADDTTTGTDEPVVFDPEAIESEGEEEAPIITDTDKRRAIQNYQSEKQKATGRARKVRDAEPEVVAGPDGDVIEGDFFDDEKESKPRKASAANSGYIVRDAQNTKYIDLSSRQLVVVISQNRASFYSAESTIPVGYSSSPESAEEFARKAIKTGLYRQLYDYVFAAVEHGGGLDDAASISTSICDRLSASEEFGGIISAALSMTPRTASDVYKNINDLFKTMLKDDEIVKYVSENTEFKSTYYDKWLMPESDFSGIIRSEISSLRSMNLTPINTSSAVIAIPSGKTVADRGPFTNVEAYTIYNVIDGNVSDVQSNVMFGATGRAGNIKYMMLDSSGEPIHLEDIDKAEIGDVPESVSVEKDAGIFYPVFASVNKGAITTVHETKNVKPYVLKIFESQGTYDEFSLFSMDDDKTDLSKYPFVLLDLSMGPIDLTRQNIDAVYESYRSFEEARNAVLEGDVNSIFTKHEVVSPQDQFYLVRTIRNPWKMAGSRELRLTNTKVGDSVRAVATVPRRLESVDGEDYSFKLTTYKSGRARRGVPLTKDRLDVGITAARIIEHLGFGSVPLPYKLEKGLDKDKSSLLARAQVLFGAIVKMREYAITDEGFGDARGDFLAILPSTEGSLYIEIPEGIAQFVEKNTNPIAALAQTVYDTAFSPSEKKVFIDLQDREEAGEDTAQQQMSMLDKGASSDKINTRYVLNNILESAKGPEIASMDEADRSKYIMMGVSNGYVAEYSDGSSHKFLKRIVQVPMWSMDDFGFYISSHTSFGRHYHKRIPGDLFVAQKVKVDHDVGGAIYTFNIYSISRSTIAANKIDTVRTYETGTDPKEFYPVDELVGEEAPMEVSEESPVYVRQSAFSMNRFFDIDIPENNAALMRAARKLVDKYADVFNIEKRQYSDILTDAYSSAYRRLYGIADKIVGREKAAKLAEQIAYDLLAKNPDDKTGVVIEVPEGYSSKVKSKSGRVELSVSSIIPPLFGLGYTVKGVGYLDYASEPKDSIYHNLLAGATKALSNMGAESIEKLRERKKDNDTLGISETPQYVAQHGEVISDAKKYLDVNGVGGDVYGPLTAYKLHTTQGDRFYLADGLSVLRCSPKVFDMPGIDAENSIQPGEVWNLDEIKHKKITYIETLGATHEEASKSVEKNRKALEQLKSELEKAEGTLKEVAGKDTAEDTRLKTRIEGLRGEIDRLSSNIAGAEAMAEPSTSFSGRAIAAEVIFITKGGTTTIAYKDMSTGTNVYHFLKRPSKKAFPDNVAKVKSEDEEEYWEDRDGNRVKMTDSSVSMATTSAWSKMFLSRAIQYNPDVESYVNEVMATIDDRAHDDSRLMTPDMYKWAVSMSGDDGLSAIKASELAKSIFMGERGGSFYSAVLEELRRTNPTMLGKILRAASAVSSRSFSKKDIQSVAYVIANFAYNNADILNNMIVFKEDASDLDLAVPDRSYVVFRPDSTANICKLFANLRPEYRRADGMLPFLRSVAEAAIRRALEVVATKPDLSEKLYQRLAGIYNVESGNNADLVNDLTSAFIGFWLDSHKYSPELRKSFVGVREKDVFDYMSAAYARANRFGMFDQSPLDMADSLLGGSDFDQKALAFLMDLLSNDGVKAYIKNQPNAFTGIAVANVLTADNLDPDLRDEDLRGVVLESMGSFASAVINRFDPNMVILRDEYNKTLAEKYISQLEDIRRLFMSGEPGVADKLRELGKNQIAANRRENIGKAFYNAFERYKVVFDAPANSGANLESMAASCGVGTSWGLDQDSSFIMNLLQCLCSDHNFAFLKTSQAMSDVGKMSSVISVVKKALSKHSKYANAVDKISDSTLAAYGRAIYADMLSRGVAKEPGKAYLAPVADESSIIGYINDTIDSGRFDEIIGSDNSRLSSLYRGSSSPMTLMSLPVVDIKQFNTMDDVMKSMASPDIGTVVALKQPHNGSKNFMYTGVSEYAAGAEGESGTMVPNWLPVSVMGNRVVFDEQILSSSVLHTSGDKWENEFEHIGNIMNPFAKSSNFVILSKILQGKIDQDPTLRRQHIHYDAGLAAKLGSIMSFAATFRQSHGYVDAETEMQQRRTYSGVRRDDVDVASGQLMESMAAILHLFASGKIKYRKAEEGRADMIALKKELSNGPVENVLINGERVDVDLPPTLVDALTPDVIDTIVDKLVHVKDFGWLYSSGIITMDSKLASAVNFIAGKLGLRLATQKGIDTDEIPFSSSDSLSVEDKVRGYISSAWHAIPESVRNQIIELEKERRGGPEKVMELFDEFGNALKEFVGGEEPLTDEEFKGKRRYDEHYENLFIKSVLNQGFAGEASTRQQLDASWYDYASRLNKSLGLHGGPQYNMNASALDPKQIVNLSVLDVAHGTMSVGRDVGMNGIRKRTTSVIMADSFAATIESTINAFGELRGKIADRENEIRKLAPASLASEIIEELRSNTTYPYELSDEMKEKIKQLPDNRNAVYSRAMQFFSTPNALPYSIPELKAVIGDDDDFIRSLEKLNRKFPGDDVHIRREMSSKFGEEWTKRLMAIRSRLGLTSSVGARGYIVSGSHFSPEFLGITEPMIDGGNVFAIRGKTGAAQSRLSKLKKQILFEMASGEFKEETLKEINDIYGVETERRARASALSLASKATSIEMDEVYDILEKHSKMSKKKLQAIDSDTIGSRYLLGLFSEVVMPISDKISKAKPSSAKERRALTKELTGELKTLTSDAFDSVREALGVGLTKVVGLGDFARYMSHIQRDMESDDFIKWVIDNSGPITDQDDETVRDMYSKVLSSIRAKEDSPPAYAALFARWLAKDDTRKVYNSIRAAQLGDAEAYDKAVESRRASAYAAMMLQSGKELSTKDRRELYRQVSKFIDDDVDKLEAVNNLTRSADSPPVGMPVIISDDRASVGVTPVRLLGSDEASKDPHLKNAHGGVVMNSENASDMLMSTGRLVDRYSTQSGVYGVVELDGGTVVSGIPDAMLFVAPEFSRVEPSTIANIENIVSFYNEHTDGQSISILDVDSKWLAENEHILSKMFIGVDEGRRSSVKKSISELSGRHAILDEKVQTIKDAIKSGRVTPSVLKSGIEEYLKQDGMPAKAPSFMRKGLRSDKAYRVLPVGQKTAVYDTASRRHVRLSGSEIGRGAWHEGYDVQVSDNIDKDWINGELASNLNNLNYKMSAIVPEAAGKTIKDFNDKVLKSVKSGTAIVTQINSGAKDYLETVVASHLMSDKKSDHDISNYINSVALNHSDAFGRVPVSGFASKGFYVFSEDGIPLVGQDGKIQPLSLGDLWVMFGAAVEKVLAKGRGVDRRANQQGLDRLLKCMGNGAVSLGPPYYFGSPIYKHSTQSTANMVIEYKYSIDQETGRANIIPTILRSGTATGGDSSTLTDASSIVKEPVKVGPGKKPRTRSVKTFERMFRNTMGLMLEVYRDGKLIISTNINNASGDRIEFPQQYSKESREVIDVRPGDSYRITSLYNIQRTPSTEDGSWSLTPASSKGKYTVRANIGDGMKVARLYNEAGMITAQGLRRKYLESVQRAAGSRTPGQLFASLNKARRDMMKKEKNIIERREQYKSLGDFLFELRNTFNDESSIAGKLDRALSGKLFTEGGKEVLTRLTDKITDSHGNKKGMGWLFDETYKKYMVGEDAITAFLKSYGQYCIKCAMQVKQCKCPCPKCKRIGESCTCKDTERFTNDLRQFAEQYNMLEIRDNIGNIKAEIAELEAKPTDHSEWAANIREREEAEKERRLGSLKKQLKSYVTSWASAFLDEIEKTTPQKVEKDLEKRASAIERLEKSIVSATSVMKKRQEKKLDVGSLQMSIDTNKIKLEQMKVDLSIMQRFYDTVNKYFEAKIQGKEPFSNRDELNDTAVSFAPLTADKHMKMIRMRTALGEKMRPGKLERMDTLESPIERKLYEMARKNLLLMDYSSVINRSSIPGANKERRRPGSVTVASDNVEEMMSEVQAKANIHKHISMYYAMGNIWVLLMRGAAGKISEDDRLKAISSYKQFLIAEAHGIAKWYNDAFIKKIDAHGLAKAFAAGIKSEETSIIHVDEEKLAANAEEIALSVATGEDVGGFNFMIGQNAAYYLFPLQNRDLLRELLSGDVLSCTKIESNEVLRKALGMSDTQIEFAQRNINNSLYYELFMRSHPEDVNRVGAAHTVSYTNQGELSQSLFIDRVIAASDNTDTGVAMAPDEEDIITRRGSVDPFNRLMSPRFMRLTKPTGSRRIPLWAKDTK